MSRQLQQFFEAHYKAMQKLVQLKRAGKNVSAFIDIPWEYAYDIELCNKIWSYGYGGLVFGLTHLHNTTNLEKLLSNKELLKFTKSVHGTSIKRHFKTNIPYAEILRQDRSVLDKIDDKELISVNYDLYCGNYGGYSDSFEASNENNVKVISGKLNFVPDQYEVIGYIIDQISQTYKNSERQILLEVPATKGFSMFPTFDEEVLSFLNQKLKDEPNIKICIDLGHILTWFNGINFSEFEKKILQLIKKYQHLIGMVHVSSCGSSTKEFKQLWNFKNKVQYPSWSLSALDSMLPVDEQNMLSMLGKIRDIFQDKQLVEVYEGRNYQQFLNDYFPEEPSLDSNYCKQMYFKESSLQAEKLGLKKINYAVIGCGRVSSKHSKAIEKSSYSKLVAVCDLNSEKLSVMDNQPEIKKYHDYRELLKDNNIDVVSVCTPSGLHEEMTINIITSGKGVVVEKPIGLDTASVTRILKKYKLEQHKASAVLQNRYNQAVKEVKKLVTNGDLGDIMIANATVRWFRPQEYYDDGWHGTEAMDGGALTNQGIHFVDAILYLLDKIPVEVYACGGTYMHQMECEDAIILTIKFSDHTIASIEATTNAYPYNAEGSVTLIGKKGMIKIGGTALNKIEYCQGDFKINKTEQLIANGYDGVYGEGHVILINEFNKHFLGLESNYIPLNEGIRAVKIIDAAYKSMKTGSPVKL